MSVNPIEYPVIGPIADRWSPYRFDQRPVENEKLLCCLEAARWAASSYNEQPWSWMIAHRQDRDQFDKLLGCLLEANQAWAANASVLMISVISTTFRRNNQPNRVALHDLGQAAAHLALQAAALGLQVHQMAGVNLSQARQVFEIPEGHQPETALAMGYPDTSEPQNEQGKELRSREQGSRKRRPLAEQVFRGSWGNSAEF